MLYYTAIALFHRVAFGTELLDALEFGGPSLTPTPVPCPTGLQATSLLGPFKGQDQLPTGNPFCFWWPCKKSLGCWGSERQAIFALRIAGEMTVRRACQCQGERAPPLRPPASGTEQKTGGPTKPRLVREKLGEKSL